MSARENMVKRIIPALLVVCVGLTVLWQATDGVRAFTTEAARRLKAERNPVKIADAELTDYAGNRLTLLNGKLTLVEFIYTTCPTICQSAGDNFYRLRERLKVSRKSNQIQMLSVSFDPERDDNDQLAAYAALHGADGHIWTVARPQIDALSDLLQAFGVTVIPDEFGGYQHNTAIHVLGRDGRLIAILDTDDIERAANVVETLL